MKSVEKPNLHEFLRSANELAQIGMEAGRLCIADLAEFIGSKIDDAMDVFGGDDE